MKKKIKRSKNKFVYETSVEMRTKFNRNAHI